MYLVFDTETSGKADFKAPASASHQPHIAQLAAILFDEKAGVVASMNFLIKPDGWLMSPEAAAVNGLTNELLEKFGIPLIVAMSCFSQLCKRATVRVAFNIQFDDKVSNAEYIRLGKPASYDHMTAFCCMNNMTDVCRIPNPNPRFGGFKWPSLKEAHQHLFKCDFEGAHDALADVNACARIFFHLKNIRFPYEPEPKSISDSKQ